MGANLEFQLNSKAVKAVDLGDFSETQFPVPGSLPLSNNEQLVFFRMHNDASPSWFATSANINLGTDSILAGQQRIILRLIGQVKIDEGLPKLQLDPPETYQTLLPFAPAVATNLKNLIDALVTVDGRAFAINDLSGIENIQLFGFDLIAD